jgi:hypothetical protein
MVRRPLHKIGRSDKKDPFADNANNQCHNCVQDIFLEGNKTWLRSGGSYAKEKSEDKPGKKCKQDTGKRLLKSPGDFIEIVF